MEFPHLESGIEYSWSFQHSESGIESSWSFQHSESGIESSYVGPLYLEINPGFNLASYFLYLVMRVQFLLIIMSNDYHD